MQRRVELTVPPERTDDLVASIVRLTGLLGIRVQRGASLQPPGDVISVDTRTAAHLPLMQLLQDRGIGLDQSSSLTITETNGVVSPDMQARLHRESSQSSWEQIETMMAKESNMTGYALVIMAISGAIAALGLTSGALHIVVGAMLIAPGFEPVIRIPFGWAARSPAWRRGLSDLAAGYGALIAGAAGAALLVRAASQPLLTGAGGYFPSEPLFSYWTTLTLSSAVITCAGALGGAILVATDRSVLTAGVMIALALIPSAAIIGVGLVAGDLGLAGRALLRWGIEVLLIAASSGVFWTVYRMRVQPRRSML
jgi:hypothetical protein